MVRRGTAFEPEASGCAQLYAHDRHGNRAVVTGTGYCVTSTTYTPNLPVDSELQVEQIFPNNRWTGATAEARKREEERSVRVEGIDLCSSLKALPLNDLPTGGASC